GVGVRVWSSTQNVFMVRRRVAAALGLSEEEVIVTATDVGGGFGPKMNFYQEEVLVALGAKLLQRPVKWIATRTEDLATTIQGRGTSARLKLAADECGRLLGLRGNLTQDLGAYPSLGVSTVEGSLPHFISAYKLPALRLEYDTVLTNTIPTGS